MDATKHYYESQADAYARQTQSADLSTLWAEIERRLPQGATVLDAGCGAGRDLRRFARAGLRPVGLDLSLPLTKLAKSYSRQPLVVSDMRSLPFRHQIFDALWCVASLLHIPRDEIVPCLRSLGRVAKPGALLVVSVKEGKGEEIDALGRRMVFYGYAEWKRVMISAGFAVVELRRSVESRTIEGGGRIDIPWLVSIAQSAPATPILTRPQGHVARR